MQTQNDMFQWIIDALAERNEPMEQVVVVAMFVNIAAINTSSNVCTQFLFRQSPLIRNALPQSFTHALYHLAARPGWIAPLRQEAESAIGEEGWTKNAMGKLVKTDSFLRESLRLHGPGTSERLLPRSL